MMLASPDFPPQPHSLHLLRIQGRQGVNPDQPSLTPTRHLEVVAQVLIPRDPIHHRERIVREVFKVHPFRTSHLLSLLQWAITSARFYGREVNVAQSGLFPGRRKVPAHLLLSFTVYEELGPVNITSPLADVLVVFHASITGWQDKDNELPSCSANRHSTKPL